MEFGFGCMRFPFLENGDVDEALVCTLVDEFIGAGYRWFDLARVYLNGKCEGVFRRTVAERYPRERFMVANKLSDSCYQKEEDIDPLFEDQLRECGVTYFDYYLVHCVMSSRYEQDKNLHVFEHLSRFKEQGRIRKMGFSFHDNPDLLERVLSEHPEVDFVQIQLNYLDWEDPVVQSRKLYETCIRHGKEILVMEPIHGGQLAQLPPEETAMLKDAGLTEPVEAAFRFIAEKEGIVRILSGMNSMEQVKQNTRLFKDIAPLSDEQEAALLSAAEHYRRRGGSGCTACGYCLAGCPKGLNIPDIIRCLNAWQSGDREKIKADFLSSVTKEETRASACIGCGQCEKACPQKQFIRKLMKRAARLFEE